MGFFQCDWGLPPRKSRSVRPRYREMLDPSLIRIAFYEGSDGARLVFFGPKEATFHSLQRCFRQLAKSRDRESIDLVRLPWIYAACGISVRLVSFDAERESQQQNERHGLRKIFDSPPTFEWRRSTEEWRYLGEMIQGLLDSDTACHQYLTGRPSDDAIVVVSKGEYPDAVLEL